MHTVACLWVDAGKEEGMTQDISPPQEFHNQVIFSVCNTRAQIFQGQKILFQLPNKLIVLLPIMEESLVEED